MTEKRLARIPTDGSLRELGLVNWAFCKLAARRHTDPADAPVHHARHQQGRCCGAGCRSAYLLYVGKLSRKDAEVVILRVGHLRDCEYELQQHRRLARTRGIGPDLQAKIFEGPDADGLTDRQRALITATDEFVVTRGVSPETWAALSSHLSRAQLVEFCMLAGQYDGLAATMTTLKMPLDYPD